MGRGYFSASIKREEAASGMSLSECEEKRGVMLGGALRGVQVWHFNRFDTVALQGRGIRHLVDLIIRTVPRLVVCLESCKSWQALNHTCEGGGQDYDPHQRRLLRPKESEIQTCFLAAFSHWSLWEPSVLQTLQHAGDKAGRTSPWEGGFLGQCVSKEDTHCSLSSPPSCSL